MKKYLAVMIILAFATPAFAQDEGACEKVSDGVWVCPLPSKPVSKPTMCHAYGESLVCTAPIDDLTPPPPARKPANCGWARKGYVCW